MEGVVDPDNENLDLVFFFVADVMKQEESKKKKNHN